jgi:hypothetical protein
MELTTNLPLQQWCVRGGRWTAAGCAATPVVPTLKRAVAANTPAHARTRAHTHTAQRYKDGPDNDPKYWPLDYPPLSGYQVRVECGCCWELVDAVNQLFGQQLHGLPVPLLLLLVLLPLLLLQSYLHGLLVGRFDPSAVALHSSRGYETHFSKQLMRWTVLLSDLLGE